MKIVIDTNVLISGVFFGGFPRRVLSSVVNGEMTACATAEISLRILHAIYSNIVFHKAPLPVYRKGRDLRSPCLLLTRSLMGCTSPTHNVLIYKTVHQLLYLV